MGRQENFFFHVTSCQLLKAAGVNYLRRNPERLIESNLNQSWLDYLENMSKQGTTADNVIIQGVSDALNLTLHL